MPKAHDLSSQLFCPRRFAAGGPELHLKSSTAVDAAEDFGLESDHLKVVLTAPIRRLQQKTQVFPLDVNSSARSRLTHSLETAEYARLFTVFLCRREPSLAVYSRQLALCAGTAALLHDAGNPPFGHFGEDIIRRFLSELTARCESALTDAQKLDLLSFNGNAQGLRIVHSIQCLNLTLGQLAAMIKVPFTASELRRRGGDPKHAGVFLSEFPLLTELRREWPERARHPLSFVMELCDDLAYSLADLEDGADKGLVTAAQAEGLGAEICALIKAPQLSLKDLWPTRAEFTAQYAVSPVSALARLREAVSRLYLDACAERICADLTAWLEHGRVETADLPAVQAVERLKRFEIEHVYTGREVEALELAGASYLKFLLAAYGQLITEQSASEFKRLLQGSGGDPYLRRLCRRISRRHLQAYLKAVKETSESELYARIRLIIDYISGMTDTYAGEEYRLLSGIS